MQTQAADDKRSIMIRFSSRPTRSDSTNGSGGASVPPPPQNVLLHKERTRDAHVSWTPRQVGTSTDGLTSQVVKYLTITTTAIATGRLETSTTVLVLVGDRISRLYREFSIHSCRVEGFLGRLASALTAVDSLMTIGVSLA